MPTIAHKFVHMALSAWTKDPNIHVLGNPELPRLSIISFTISHQGRNLHHDFVVALLNDLFGIQARGGCSCAGPYGHRLLQIDIDQSRAFEASIAEGCGGIKPGWVRLGFNYFISDTVAEYIIEAVKLIAAEGWKLLPLYHFDPDNGSWRHRHARPGKSLNLSDLDLSRDNPKSTIPTASEDLLDMQLSTARLLLQSAGKAMADENAETTVFNQTAEQLRWFTLPKDVEEELASRGDTLSPQQKQKFIADFLPWSP